MTVRQDANGEEAKILHGLVDLTGTDVLEIGCGDGRLTWQYCAKARSVLALDPKAEKIDAAQREARRLDYRHVAFETGNIVTRDLSPASFDVAILSRSL